MIQTIQRIDYNIEDIENEVYLEMYYNDEVTEEELLKEEIDFLKKQNVEILEIKGNQVIIQKPDFEIKFEVVPFTVYDCNNEGKISIVDENFINQDVTIKDKKLKFIYECLVSDGYDDCEVKGKGVKFSCKLCSKTNQNMIIFGNKNNFKYSTFSKNDCNDMKHKEHYGKLANRIFNAWKKANTEDYKKDNLPKYSKKNVNNIVAKHFPKLIRDKESNSIYYYDKNSKKYEELTQLHLEELINKYFFDDIDEISVTILKNIDKTIKISGIEKKKLNTEVINFKNGIFNIKTQKMEKHTNKYFTTNKIDINYDDTVDTKDIEKIIKSWKMNISLEELTNVLGYLFSYDNSEQYFFYVHGLAGTGKGSFGHMLKYCLSQNCSTVDTKDLLNNTHGTAVIKNKTCVIETDLNDKALYGDIKILNKITDGDDVNINPKNIQGYQYTSTCKYICFANDTYKLSSSSDTGGFKRRVYPIVFNRVFSGTKDEKDIKRIFENNENLQCQFLKLAMKGLKNIIEKNPDDGKLLNKDKLLVEEWDKSSENVYSFFDTLNITCKKEDYVTIKELKDNYFEYCDEQNIKPLSMPRLKMKIFTMNPKLVFLNNQNVIKIDGKSTRVLKGVTLEEIDVEELENRFLGVENDV